MDNCYKHYLVQFYTKQGEVGYAIVNCKLPSDAEKLLKHQGRLIDHSYGIYAIEELNYDKINKCCVPNTILAEGVVKKGDKGDRGVSIKSIRVTQQDNVVFLHIYYDDLSFNTVSYIVPDSVVTATEAKEEVNKLSSGNTFLYYTEETLLDGALYSGVYTNCVNNEESNNPSIAEQDELYTVVVDAKFNTIENVCYITQHIYSKNYPSRAFVRNIKCIISEELEDQEELTEKETPVTPEEESIFNLEEFINSSTKTFGDYIEIDYKIDVNPYIIVDLLPEAGSANINPNKIYVVPSVDLTDNLSIKVEYAYINGNWEKLGEYKEKVAPVNYTAGVTLGGLTKDTNLAGKSAYDILDMILQPEYAPRWTEASATLNYSGKLVIEVGTKLPQASAFTITGNKASTVGGSYTAYCGDATDSDPAIAGSKDTNDNKTNFEGTAKLDTYTISMTRTYADGTGDNNVVKTNKGNKTQKTADNNTTLLEAASTNSRINSTYHISGKEFTRTATITAVYPIYATTETPGELKKQSLTTAKTDLEYTLQPSLFSADKYLMIAIVGTISSLKQPHPALANLWVDLPYTGPEVIYLERNSDNVNKYSGNLANLIQEDLNDPYTYKDTNNNKIYTKYNLYKVRDENGNSIKVHLTFS